MGLKSSANSPCLFIGTLIDGKAPINVGIYVDDIIYFSPDDQVEKKFKELLSTIGEVDFMGQVSHFLGIEFTWHTHADGNVSVNLTQQSFIENLLDTLGYSEYTNSAFVTPYQFIYSFYPYFSNGFLGQRSTQITVSILSWQS